MSLTKKDLEELVKTMQADYAAINNKLSKLDSLVDDVADLKKLLAASEAKNVELHALLKDRDVELHALKRQLIVWSSTTVPGVSESWDSHSQPMRKDPATW
jgi:hypothetical protein